MFVVTSSVRGEICGRHHEHALLSVVRLIVEFLFLSIPPLHHTRAVTLSHFPNIYVISHIFEPFLKFLRHFQHCKAASQILKRCIMYLSHFPNILAISQVSKSFFTFLSRLSIIKPIPNIFEPFPKNRRHFHNILVVSQILKPFPTYIRHFPHS